MGTSLGSRPDDPEEKVVMGYPFADWYHQPPHTYPHTLSVCPAGQVYTSSSFPIPYGYTSSQFPHDNGYPGCGPSTAQNAYDQPYRRQYYPTLPESCNNSTLGRVIVILMVVLLSSMCLMSLVMWFLLGAYIPEIEVASLKVSNFSATDKLTGTWKVYLSIRNVNKDVAIQFDEITSSVLYKDALLVTTTLRPFQVPTTERVLINFGMSAGNDHKNESGVLSGLSRDLSRGTMVFGLKVAMKAVFRTPSAVRRDKGLQIFCDNMQIMFHLLMKENWLQAWGRHA